MWWSPTKVESANLIAESESVLSGRYAELLEERPCPIPAWAWLNLLAHGTEDELRDPGPASGRVMARRWRDARSHLAGDVLDRVARGGVSLSELQRAVLVPLELQLMPREAPQPQNPHVLVTLVTAELDAYEDEQRRQRHPSSGL